MVKGRNCQRIYCWPAAYYEAQCCYPLHEHLVNVYRFSEKYFRSRASKIRISQIFSVWDVLSLSTLFHDLGKISRDYCVEDERLTFKWHEMVSAIILYNPSRYFNDDRSQLLKLSAYAISLHHSAMRTPSNFDRGYEKHNLCYVIYGIYEDDVKTLFKKVRSNISIDQRLEEILNEIENSTLNIRKNRCNWIGDLSRDLVNGISYRHIPIELKKAMIIAAGYLIVSDIIVAGCERAKTGEEVLSPYVKSWMNELGIESCNTLSEELGIMDCGTKHGGEV